jgi:hypothetical protein
MNWARFCGVTAVMLGLALQPSNVSAQALKDQIVGVWSFVSSLDIYADGRTVDRWGGNPRGIFILDKSGHYAFFITRSDLPSIAAGRYDQGTADEYKAIMQGLGANFGSYSVDETDKTLITKVVGSAYPNLNGREQKRIITTLNADELKYTNTGTTAGMRAESTWRRLK